VALQCVTRFHFLDNVTFLHNGVNGLESTTTRMFRPVRQVAAPTAKFVVSDCILLGCWVRNAASPGDKCPLGPWPSRRHCSVQWKIYGDYELVAVSSYRPCSSVNSRVVWCSWAWSAAAPHHRLSRQLFSWTRKLRCPSCIQLQTPFTLDM